MLKYGLNTHFQSTSLETGPHARTACTNRFALKWHIQVNFENLSHSPVFLLSTWNFCFMLYKSCAGSLPLSIEEKKHLLDLRTMKP